MQAIIQYWKLYKNAEEQYHQHALDHEKQTRPSTRAGRKQAKPLLLISKAKTML
jgi:hypothetical protein